MSNECGDKNYRQQKEAEQATKDGEAAADAAFGDFGKRLTPMPSSKASLSPQTLAEAEEALELADKFDAALGDATILSIVRQHRETIARALRSTIAVSAIERSQVLHLLAVFRHARRHIEYRGAFTPHTEMLRQMDLQLEIFKGFDGLGPDVHDDIGHTP